MALGFILLTLQVLAIKHVFTYPVQDYILAYIPIDQLQYLGSTVEYIPVTLCYVVSPDSYSTRYYGSQTNSRGLQTSSSGLTVYSTSIPLTVFQCGSMTTVTVLPCPSVPEVISVPSTPVEVATPVLPNNQYEVYEATDESEYINTQVPVELPEPRVVLADQPDILAEGPVTFPDTSFVTVEAPISGKVTFSGNIPASGTIRIYANCFC